MQIDYTTINNQLFAILIWYIQEGEEDKAKVYSGIASWNAESASVEIFRGDVNKPALEISGEQLEKIALVTPKIKDILLGAAYYITLTMRDLPGDDEEGFNKIGLKW